jgi:hypothetical protein
VSDKFFASGHCRKSSVHCVSCRTDAGWRQSLVNAGLVQERDFDCPHGITSATAPAEQAEAFAKMGNPDGMKNTMRQVRQQKGCSPCGASIIG